MERVRIAGMARPARAERAKDAAVALIAGSVASMAAVPVGIAADPALAPGILRKVRGDGRRCAVFDPVRAGNWTMAGASTPFRLDLAQVSPVAARANCRRTT